MKQEIGWQWHHWTLCRSFTACFRQIRMPVLHQSVFTICMLFLMYNNSVKALIHVRLTRSLWY